MPNPETKGKHHLTGAGRGLTGGEHPEVPQDARGHPIGMVHHWMDRRRGELWLFGPAEAVKPHLEDFSN